MSVVIQKNIFAKLAVLLRLFCLSFMLICYQNSVAQGAGESVDVEEIVVTGQRSLRAMRLEVETAEKEIYDFFNEIYADTDYEITCVRERPLYDSFNPNSAWSARVCRSSLAHDLYKEELEDYGEYVNAELNGDVAAIVDTQYFEDRNLEHNEDLLQKFNDLLGENPEHIETVEKYAQLKTDYEAAVEADFAKGNFFTNLFRSRD